MTPPAILLALLVPVAVRAQETPAAAPPLSLSIEQAIEKALEQSEDVRIGGERRERMEDTYVKVKGQAYPQIDGSLRWSHYADKPITVADFGGGPRKVEMMRAWELEAGATLSQVLWAFGKVSTAIDIARRAIDLEGLAQDATRNEVSFAAKQAYLTILLAQDTLAIAEESYQNALENQRALTSRMGGGRASRVDNVKMAADAQSRVPPKLEARRRHNSLMIAFKRLIGAEADAEVALTDAMSEEFPEQSRSELLERMTANEPSLRVARRRIGLNDEIVRLRKADNLPTLSALSRFRYYGNAEDPIPGSLYRDPSLLVGVQLSVPIWHGGTWRGALEEAERDRNISSFAYDKRRRDLGAELDSALSEYASAVGIYRAAQEALKLAEESYGISLSSFKAGKASQLQLNDAELQLTSAKLGAKRSLYDINLIMARIEKLAGPESGK
ncbi:MAG: TolC family protein [Elusimicrobiota bacterium]